MFDTLSPLIGISLSLLILLLMTVLALLRVQYWGCRLLAQGHSYVYGLSVVGTPIHELSHAIMCYLFGHKVDRVVFFAPDGTDTLGYVEHRFESRNLYHQVGRLFIGLAPIAGASAMVYCLGYALIPTLWQPLMVWSATLPLQQADRLPEILTLFGDILNHQVHWLIVSGRVETGRFVLFLWLSSAIALHAIPSPQDLRGAFPGAIACAFVVVVSVFLPQLLQALALTGIRVLTVTTTILMICLMQIIPLLGVASVATALTNRLMRRRSNRL